MRPLAEKYNTTYTKKIDIDRDTFLPRLARFITGGAGR